MNRLDRTACIVISIITLLLVIVIFIGSEMPLQIACVQAPSCEAIGPFASLRFEFSHPVDTVRVESSWNTEPALEGRWTWEDGRHGRWQTIKPLRVGQTLDFGFSAGVLGLNGEKVTTNHTWRAQVRSPRMVYLSRKDGGSELYSFDPQKGDEELQLTHTGGKVYDYAVSLDGEQIIFSVMNEERGVDLWSTNRQGDEPMILLNCEADRCTMPAWSPWGEELVFTRERSSTGEGSPMGAPRPWVFNLLSGKNQPVFSDSQKIGYGPAFSPDGNWFSIWNGLSGGIEIVNRQSGDTFILTSSSGNTGSWSADSRYLYYTEIVQGETFYRSVVMRADLSTRQVKAIAGDNLDPSGFGFSQPACNPQGNDLAVLVQPDAKIPGRALWLLSSDGAQIRVISSDLTLLVSGFSWSVDGTSLLYLADTLTGKDDGATIMLWDRNAATTSRVLREKAYFPSWLP